MPEFSWRQRVSWRLQAAIVPSLGSSQESYFEMLEQFLATAPLWLDVGCGREIVPRWFHPRRFARASESVARAKTVVGLDFDFASLKDNQLACRICGDAGALPFAEGCFDLVTANMVVEHLDAPVAWLREVARVLKPGGVLVFHTPNVLSPVVAVGALAPDWIKERAVGLVEGRKEQDVFPTRYRLNTPARIKDCARRAGFAVEQIRTVCTSPFTQFLGPLVIPELIMIRLIMTPPLAFARPDIVAVLKKM
jgi:SAM-dependent methyltransferase